MVSAQKLAEHALAVANRFLNEEKDRLLESVEGDLDILVEAAHIVREETAHGSSLERSAEHLAFSLLTAAFDAGRKKV